MNDRIPSHDIEHVALVGEDAYPLMKLTALSAIEVRDPVHVAPAFLAALQALGSASPGLQTALRSAAARGEGLMVTFPPEVVNGLRLGSLHLMQSGDGTIPTALDVGGKIVSHARVVRPGLASTSDIGAGGLVAGATAGTLVVTVLPIVIACSAAYAQQRHLEKSLASIKAVVERIEERLEDADRGVCIAAEQFIELVESSLAEGGLTAYLRLELASQRTAVEALYSARKAWVDRFKRSLEREQIERERTKGRGQPWVDAVSDQVKSGRLEEELTLFVRSLLSRTKLSVLAAAAIAEEGRGVAALNLIRRTETELRSEFFDLHRRLVPLARIAPETSRLDKLPRIGALERVPEKVKALVDQHSKLERAHDSVKILVDHFNRHVLPFIPDPDGEREVQAVLSAAMVSQLSADLESNRQ